LSLHGKYIQQIFLFQIKFFSVTYFDKNLNVKMLFRFIWCYLVLFCVISCCLFVILFSLVFFRFYLVLFGVVLCYFVLSFCYTVFFSIFSFLFGVVWCCFVLSGVIWNFSGRESRQTPALRKRSRGCGGTGKTSFYLSKNPCS